MKKSSGRFMTVFNSVVVGTALLLLTGAQAGALPEKGKSLHGEEITALMAELERDWVPVAKAETPVVTLGSLSHNRLFFKNKKNDNWLSIKSSDTPSLWVEEMGTNLKISNKQDFMPPGATLASAPLSEGDKKDIRAQIEGFSKDELVDAFMSDMVLSKKAENAVREFFNAATREQLISLLVEKALADSNKISELTPTGSIAKTLCGDHDETVAHLKTLDVLPVLQGKTEGGNLMEVFAHPGKKKDRAYTVLMTEGDKSCKTDTGLGFQFTPG